MTPVMSALREIFTQRLPPSDAPHPDPVAFQPEPLLAFATRVTDAYNADSRLLDSEFAGSWRALLDHAREVHALVKPLLSIEFSTRTVYFSPEDIAADVARGRLEINTEHCEHPLWTPEENCIFRVVHDIIPHVLFLRPFSLEGEVLSYHDHLRWAPPEGKLALFTEIFGYAAIRYSTGYYPEHQKCIVFPELVAEYEASFLPRKGAARPAA
jgi:hypothetical protein